MRPGRRGAGRPIYLKRRPELGGFIIRTLAARVACRVPGFGARGALIEVLAVVAVQVMLIDPARMLPVIALAALLGVVKHWLWISWGSLVVYALAVAWASRAALAGGGRRAATSRSGRTACPCAASRPHACRRRDAARAGRDGLRRGGRRAARPARPVGRRAGRCQARSVPRRGH